MARFVVYGRSAQLGVPELVRGARALGFDVVERRVTPDHTDADVMRNAAACVVVGHGAEPGRIRAQYEFAGVRTAALDLPRLRVAADRVGLYCHDTPHTLPMTLGHAVVRGVGRELPKGKPADPARVIIAGQAPNDAAHKLTESELHSVYVSAAQAARALWPRATVVFRPHPQAFDALDRLAGAFVDDVDGEPDAFTALSHHADHGAVLIAYNSGIGWDAIQAGVPVVHAAPASRCAWSEFGVRLGFATPRRLTPGEAAVALMRAASSDVPRAALEDGSGLAALLGNDVPSGTGRVELWTPDAADADAASAREVTCPSP